MNAPTHATSAFACIWALVALLTVTPDLGAEERAGITQAGGGTMLVDGCFKLPMLVAPLFLINPRLRQKTVEISKDAARWVGLTVTGGFSHHRRRLAFMTRQERLLNYYTVLGPDGQIRETDAYGVIHDPPKAWCTSESELRIQYKDRWVKAHTEVDDRGRLLPVVVDLRRGQLRPSRRRTGSPSGQSGKGAGGTRKAEPQDRDEASEPRGG